MLVGLVAAALYPNGPSAASVPGPDFRIYRGWPNAAALDADMRAGKVNVTMYPASRTGRVSTRYVQECVGTPVPPSLTAQVLGVSVTFGGLVAPGQVAGLAIDGVAYAYRAPASDNSAPVAANVAALVRANRIALVSGSTITLPGAGEVLGRVVADAPAQQAVRRHTQVFRVTC